jgi:protein-tyrosine phosphatase
MDEDNLASIRSSLPSNSQATVRLFLDYADGVKTREVPDPYYNGRFDEVYDLVLAGSTGLLEAIRKEHHL